MTSSHELNHQLDHVFARLQLADVIASFPRCFFAFLIVFLEDWMTERTTLITTSNLTLSFPPGYKKLRIVVDDRVFVIDVCPRGRDDVEPTVVHGNGQRHEQKLVEVKKEDQAEQSGQAERHGQAEQRLFKFNLNSNTVHPSNV